MHRAPEKGPRNTSDAIKAAYADLLTRIFSGALIPTISHDQMAEWCPGGDPTSGLEIAQVLDKAPACYEIAHFVVVFEFEVLLEFSRMRNLTDWKFANLLHDAKREPPYLEFLVEHSKTTRAQWRETGLIGTSHLYKSIGDSVRAVATNAKPGGVYSADVYSRFKWAFDESRPRTAVDQTNPWEAIIERLARLPSLQEILSSVEPNRSVTEVLREIDFNNCRCLRYWPEFWKQYTKGKATVNKNDEKDIAFFPAYIYCDYSLTEKQVAHYLRLSHTEFKSRVFTSPVELCAALDRA